jgi:pimeloyl-ACP methyl ester carboxylesterase
MNGYKRFLHKGTLEMNKSIKMDNLMINYTDTGSGTPVICLHGNPGCASDFSGADSGDNFRIIALDRPGHGQSDRYPSKKNHLNEQTTFIKQFTAALGIESFILAGHSWGAFIALNYAMTYPKDVLSMILFAPIAFPRERVTSPSSGLVRAMQNPFIGKPVTALLAGTAGKKAVTTAMENGFLPATMPDTYRNSILPGFTTPDAFRAMCEDKGDFEFQVMEKSKHYNTIKTKTRIVCGENDVVAPGTGQAIPLAAVLPNSTLLTIKNMGHQIPLQSKNSLVEQLKELTAQ